MNVYDSVDDDVLQSYNEFLLLSSTYFCLKEAACSEQSSRMTAMDAASKNAGLSCSLFHLPTVLTFFLKSNIILYNAGTEWG